MMLGPGEADPSQSLGGERLGGAPPATAARVTFDRRELGRILGLYGRKVAEGEWRDYAIDFIRDAYIPHRKKSSTRPKARSLHRDFCDRIDRSPRA